MPDIHAKRRSFFFAHAVTQKVKQPGDSYRATFGLALRMRVSLMTVYAQLLRDSEAVLQRRLRWLRRRKLLAPRPRPIRVRDVIVDLFAAPDIAPAPT